MDRFFNITNNNLAALNLFDEDTMQVLLTQVEEISQENQCLTKDRLYIKLQEIHNQKTGRDRTHIDAMMLFGKRRKTENIGAKQIIIWLWLCLSWDCTRICLNIGSGDGI